ncbi:hypothetical protein OIE71_00050 [Streptomyces sp. NBC_01725]|uniref:hypothetical protein n=1 Tax=Streptomyces sp. NBC_01725 TaxID=2975923 RepID=UPI002E27FCAF|nr:hypothetical protein [Streptomyces sp. NBC_01725]
MPVAFVFTGRTQAQRANRIRRLEHAARRYFADEPYPGRAAGITAVDYHHALPAVVTELERITADPDGAGPVWRRLGREEWQTLPGALDNHDGDRLHTVQREQARRRKAEREAAQREAQRPVCAGCGAKFTDTRWQQTRRSSWPGERDNLCQLCEQEDVDRAEAARIAVREAEEATAREAAEAETKKHCGLFGRRR